MTAAAAAAGAGGWLRRATGAQVPVLAHRGGRGPWPENTVEAFQNALVLGADGVELDVRLGPGRVLFVHHDATVPGLGPVAELRADDRPPWLPTLEESLAACAGALVNVEIKNSPFEPGHDPEEAVAHEVACALRRCASWPSDRRPAHVVVSSFQQSSLETVRSEAPDLALGLLVPGFVNVSDTNGFLGAPSVIEQAAGLGLAAMHLNHERATAQVVAEVHAAGMAVVAWTVNDPQRVRELVDSGVDALITDEVESTLAELRRPGGLVRGLDRRGQSNT